MEAFIHNLNTMHSRAGAQVPFVITSYSIHYTKLYDYTIPWLLALIISSVITCIIMIILTSKNKMVKKASVAKEYLDSASVNYTNRNDEFISTHTTSYTVSSSSGGGGGGSHSGSSGGGHGGGGGRHG